MLTNFSKTPEQEVPQTGISTNFYQKGIALFQAEREM
jgi:hypothetical protein